MSKDNTSNDFLSASTLLLFLFLAGSTFCAVLCIDEHKTISAMISASCGAVFLLLTIWSNKKPFISMLIGLIIYIILVVTLVTFFPRVIAEGIGISFLSPYIYLTLGFLGGLYVIASEYKKTKNN